MIEFRGVTKTYKSNGYKAVDELTFTVNDGEIFGFLGPNGAGKSTALKCLTGILGFESGEIFVNGIDIGKDPVRAKGQIGFVPDEHLVYEGLKGIQYLNFVADIFGVSEADRQERMEKYLPRFDMEDKIRDACSSYSHGMMQKLSILSALIHEPKVFVLDEPMTGLDPQAAHALKEIMAEYAREGKSVLFSSHVLDVVEKVCNRFAILDKGKLISVCAIDELPEKQTDASLESFFLRLTKGENK